MAQNSKLVFIVEEILLDIMENEIDSAIKYNVVGFTRDEAIAKRFCSNGKTYTEKDCWALMKPTAQYRYKPINELE